MTLADLIQKQIWIFKSKTFFGVYVLYCTDSTVYLDIITDTAELSFKWGWEKVWKEEGEGEDMLTSLQARSSTHHGLHSHIGLTCTIDKQELKYWVLIEDMY